MSRKPLGIALVGTGFGQKVHIPAIQDCPDATVVAIYHRDLEKARAIAHQHQIPTACNTLEQILALPEVDGISLSTPPFLHYDMARKVLQAKKHLFLEKPVTLDANEAQALTILSDHQGLTTGVNFEFRFVPAWMQLKTQLSQNYVGTPRLITIDWLVPGRADSKKPWSWHGSKQYGGGSLGALGSHVFDYVSWLFGPVHTIQAKLLTTIAERPDSTTGQMKVMDADDTCLITLGLKSGAFCHVSISATTYNGRGHWVEVYGDRGTLILGSDNLTDYVHGFTLRGSQNGAPLSPIAISPAFEFTKTHADGRIAPVSRVFEAWVHAIETSTPLVPSIHEGLYSQQLMDFAHQSNHENKVIEVNVA